MKFGAKGPNGVDYYGRGALQLTHYYNYRDFSKWLYGDESVLLNNPEKVALEGELAFLSALWFWMFYKDAELIKETCHQ
jgi:predicted chitinase